MENTCLIDTNILVSAFVFGGSIKQKLIRILRHKRVRILISESILAEMKAVLLREQFLSHRSADVLMSQLENFRKIAEPVQVKSSVNDCRDRKDNLFLDCALDGRADFILTGDNDLLELDPYHSIRIMKIADFIDLIAHD